MNKLPILSKMTSFEVLGLSEGRVSGLRLVLASEDNADEYEIELTDQAALWLFEAARQWSQSAAGDEAPHVKELHSLRVLPADPLHESIFRIQYTDHKNELRQQNIQILAAIQFLEYANQAIEGLGGMSSLAPDSRH